MTSLIGIVEEEPIFVGHKCEVLFYGQPAGMILAKSFALANLAVKKVKISYIQSGWLILFVVKFTS